VYRNILTTARYRQNVWVRDYHLSGNNTEFVVIHEVK